MDVRAGVDWGYTNPGGIGVGAIDKDGRLIIVHETYQTRRLIGWWVDKARNLRELYGISKFVCDPSEPGYIEEFNAAGLRAVGANNDVRLGIQAVQTRLVVQEDGLPRLMYMLGALDGVDPDLLERKKPTGLLQEMPGYVWNDKRVKEEPVKADDHAVDWLRYLCMDLDAPVVATAARAKAVNVHGGRVRQRGRDPRY